jgi:hypothetical protein
VKGKRRTHDVSEENSANATSRVDRAYDFVGRITDLLRWRSGQTPEDGSPASASVG